MPRITRHNLTCITLFVLAMLVLPAQAQRKKVGLVLSGGGAKGIAHVGVLKVLEEANIPIDIITGTSMGAVVGGLYSIGYSAAQLDSLVRVQDWAKLLSDNITRQNRLFVDREFSDKSQLSIPLTKERRLKMPAGIVAGQEVLNLLTSLTIGYHDSMSFNSMPIPFACVAYDIVKGKEVVFHSGSLPMAIRASMSIPGAFNPVSNNGQLLIDGGISNNLPADVARAMGADIIIGVDVSEGMYEADEINSMFHIINQLTTIIGNEKYKSNVKQIDLYLHPQTKPYTITSFNKEAIDTLTYRGEMLARANLDKLCAIRDSVGLSRLVVTTKSPKAHGSLSDSVTIDNIRIEGLTPTDRSKVQSLIRIKENARVRVSDITAQVNALRSTGLFSSVSYKLHRGKDKQHDLILYLKEGTRNSLNFGLRYDTEEDAAIFVGSTIATRALRGSELQLAGRLGTSSYINLGYRASENTLMKNVGISYLYAYNNNDIYIGGKKQVNVAFQQHAVDLNLSGFYVNRFGMKLGAQYEFLDYQSLLLSNKSDIIELKSGGYLSYYANLHFENLNDSYFPTKGSSIFAGYTLTTDNGLKLNGHFPMGALSFEAYSAISVSRRVAFIPAIYARFVTGSDIPYPYMNLLGGVVKGRYRAQQLPFIGVSHCEPMENSLVVGRLDFRVRLWRNHFVSLKGNYSLAANEFSDILHGDDIIGGGLEYAYNTLLGPISLTVNTSSLTKKVGVYFSLFRYF